MSNNKSSTGSKPEIGWHFPSNDGGVIDGPNDSEIDTFAGARFSSLVREVVQNSLDARAGEDDPVKLFFDFDVIEGEDSECFRGILPHIQASEKEEKSGGSSDIIQFYQEAIRLLKQKPEVPVLCIHDANTTGLTSPTTKKPEAPDLWRALIKGSGVSQKRSGSSLGSFGHGSKAPFAMSQLRTVFYYSKVPVDGGFERRFQGKSILQSHICPYDKKTQTRGTGFYGKTKGNRLLSDKEIPPWPQILRERWTKGVGTSIYIPHALEDEESKSKIIITLVANFFFAILEGKLVVRVADQLIDSDNVKQQFEWCKEKMKSGQDGIDEEQIKDCFESIQTIVNPNSGGVDQLPSGEQELKNFGLIKWYIRVDDDCGKAVGIARESGMLITRQPVKLKRFHGVKEFDLFVCVLGEEGSGLLRRLENPQHDAFEFDRITSSEERARAKKQYDFFVKEIRKIIERFASLRTEDEEIVEELDDIFGWFAEGFSKDNLERGVQLQLFDSPVSKITSKPAEWNTGGGGEETDGRGRRGGDTGPDDSGNGGGNIPDPGGRTSDGILPGDDDLRRTGREIVVQDFRVRPDDSNKKRATLFFTCPVSGRFDFFVSKVGEHGHEDVRIVVDGALKNSVRIDVTGGEREEKTLSFAEEIDQFVLEGKLLELTERW